MTDQQSKKAQAKALWLRDPSRSNRDIAAAVSCSHSSVGNWRTEWELEELTGSVPDQVPAGDEEKVRQLCLSKAEEILQLLPHGFGASNAQAMSFAATAVARLVEKALALQGKDGGDNENSVPGGKDSVEALATRLISRAAPAEPAGPRNPNG